MSVFWQDLQDSLLFAFGPALQWLLVATVAGVILGAIVVVGLGIARRMNH